MRRDTTNARRIIPVCAMLSACAVLILVRSGKAPSVLSLGKRDSKAENTLRQLSTKRYFYNRTAIRYKKPTEVRQCYHLSRTLRNTLLDVDSRDVIGCKQRLPNVIVVGAKGSGEETLRFFLEKHPSVVFHSWDTIRYFDRPFLRQQKGMPWYLDKMPYTSPDQLTVEMGTDYFTSPAAPDGIRNDIVPKPKLLVIIRDPVKRALIEYHNGQSFKKEEPTSAKVKAAGQYPYLGSYHHYGSTFANSVMDAEGTVQTWNGLVNVGIYVIQLRRWYEWFGRSQVLVVDGDRLETSNPIHIVQEIEDFIGVPRFFDEKAISFDAESKAYCSLKPFNACPPPRKTYSAPDQGIFNKLRSFYSRYDLQLYQMLGRNFTWFKESLFVNKSAISFSETHQIAEPEAPVQESSDQLLEEEEK